MFKFSKFQKSVNTGKSEFSNILLISKIPVSGVLSKSIIAHKFVITCICFPCLLYFYPMGFAQESIFKNDNGGFMFVCCSAENFGNIPTSTINGIKPVNESNFINKGYSKVGGSFVEFLPSHKVNGVFMSHFDKDFRKIIC